MNNTSSASVGQAGVPASPLGANPPDNSKLSAEAAEKNKPTMTPKAVPPSESIGWKELPGDYITSLFDMLAQQVCQAEGPSKKQALHTLLQFGSTSVGQHKCLEEFLTNHSNAPRLRAEIANFRQAEWRQQATDIKNHLDQLRDDFSRSASILAAWSVFSNPSNSSSAVHQAALPHSLEKFMGIQMNFETFRWQPEMTSNVSSLSGKVVKLEARAIGRERFLNEVLPALKALSADCPIVLDVSNNGLLPEDLAQLIGFMKVTPTIYRLDISNNPVVSAAKASVPMTELFAEPGPLTHLYLANTGFNDATAQSVNNALVDAVQQDIVLLQHLDFRNNPLSGAGVANIIRGTFDPNFLGTFYSDESPPKMAYSLRSVRFNSLVNEYGNDIEQARQDFFSAASLFNTYQMYLADRAAYEERGVVGPNEVDFSNIFEFIIAIADSSGKHLDGGLRFQVQNDFFQRRADQERL